ncbi:SDR family oxidoreductase, partial [Peribacillus frigoritolerans]|uniref:SDR family NAD(P)-dependent oxidoreductase n=2 Tax=Bacillaceae TaxID=186817 RepID=UPI00300995ED
VKPFLEMDPESYHRVVDVDQHGVYYGMYYAARKMVELGVTGATIVNTASIYGTMVSIGSFNYHAAKAAVIAMTKSGAIELAQYGIRVVGVAPGFIETPIIGEDQEFLDSLAQLHMRKKLIQPEKVAEVVTFLFSEKADAINGQVIPVDDGFLSFKG